MGSPTGDGSIQALQGKAALRRFSTGRLVSDSGIPLLHNFPLLKIADSEGAVLLIDGPFTNAGLAALAGLDGVFDLDLSGTWITSRRTGSPICLPCRI